MTFSISAAVLAWCRAVSNNKVIYQKLKTIRDLMLQQHNCLKNFAVEFMQKVKIYAQYSSTAHQNRVWQDLNALIINAEKRQKRVKKSIRFMKRDDQMKRWISWCSRSEIIILRTKSSSSSKNILSISKRSWKDCNWQYLNVKKRWIEIFERLLRTSWTILNALTTRFILIFLRRLKRIFALLIW